MNSDDLIGALPPELVGYSHAYTGSNDVRAAAIAIGYPPSAGPSLLTKAKTTGALETARRYQAERLGITTERVLVEYARIAFFDPRKLYKDDGTPKAITDLDTDTAAAIASVDSVHSELNGAVVSRAYRYKLSPKLAALDALAKHLDLFAPERIELSGVVGDPLTELTVNDKARRVAFMLAAALARRELIDVSDG